MKKLCALLVALCVLMTAACAVAESDMVRFDGTLVPVMEYTPAEWYESETNRCLFTVLASLDYSLEFQLGGDAIDWTSPTFTGLRGGVAMTFFRMVETGEYVTVLYSPDEEGMAVIPLWHTSGAELESGLLGELCDQYSENDVNTIKAVTDMLVEALAD